MKVTDLKPQDLLEATSIGTMLLFGTSVMGGLPYGSDLLKLTLLANRAHDASVHLGDVDELMSDIRKSPLMFPLSAPLLAFEADMAAKIISGLPHLISAVPSSTVTKK